MLKHRDNTMTPNPLRKPKLKVQTKVRIHKPGTTVSLFAEKQQSVEIPSPIHYCLTSGLKRHVSSRPRKTMNQL